MKSLLAAVPVTVVMPGDGVIGWLVKVTVVPAPSVEPPAGKLAGVAVFRWVKVLPLTIVGRLGDRARGRAGGERGKDKLMV